MGRTERAGNVGPERISDGWEKLSTPTRRLQWKRIEEIRIEHRTEDRVRWLLDFAARDLDKLNPEDWFALYVEVLFFLSPIPVMRGGATERHPPAFPAEARFLQRWVRRGLVTLAEGGEWRFGTKRTYALRVSEEGILERPIEGGQLRDQFMIAVFEALMEARERLRSCVECHRLFIARKRQAYCTPRCSQAARTRKYRRKQRR